ncbi:MAG: TIGR02757 family protein [Planctomycetes bacterium]|nr:TIGR02757 family protein [Planctomycetota bacterium]
MKGALENLYARYNRREYAHPDPVEFLYAYEHAADREIAGLAASSLAYGRVGQILKSVANVLEILGPRPAAWLLETPPGRMRKAFQGFRHRFATGKDVAGMLEAASRMLSKHGSLNAAFTSGMQDPRDIPGGLSAFAAQLRAALPANSHLVPRPESGSPCKRLHLYLRWMVRSDRVDPGGWNGISPAGLVIPLDTHMFRIGRILGLTCRKQPDIRTAVELTEAFRRWSPLDPVKYDFALTRLGIRADADMQAFLAECRDCEAVEC